MRATASVDRTATGRLTRSGGCRGVPPPGDTVSRLARGAVVPVRHCCRADKRDGTAGLVGC